MLPCSVSTTWKASCFAQGWRHVGMVPASPNGSAASHVFAATDLTTSPRCLCFVRHGCPRAAVTLAQAGRQFTQNGHVLVGCLRISSPYDVRRAPVALRDPAGVGPGLLQGDRPALGLMIDPQHQRVGRYSIDNPLYMNQTYIEHEFTNDPRAGSTIPSLPSCRRFPESAILLSCKVACLLAKVYPHPSLRSV